MPGASQTEISMSPIFNESQVTHALFQFCMKKKLAYKYLPANKLLELSRKIYQSMVPWDG
jgi:hypothetical protein